MSEDPCERELISLCICMYLDPLDSPNLSLMLVQISLAVLKYNTLVAMSRTKS